MALSLNGMQTLGLRMSEVRKVRRAMESGPGGFGALSDGKALHQTKGEGLPPERVF